jgi:hypothetical protein
MKKSRFSEEQITYALRQADSGTPVADICRQLGVSEASFYQGRIAGRSEQTPRTVNAQGVVRKARVRIGPADWGFSGSAFAPLPA